MEIKPEDIIVSVPARTTWSLKEPTKVIVYHKRLGITVESDIYKSQHKNKQDCIEQLRGLV